MKAGDPAIIHEFFCLFTTRSARDISDWMLPPMITPPLPIPPSRGGSGPPSNTVLAWSSKFSHQMASRSVQPIFHNTLCGQTDDRQTDHATVTCVGIGGIALLKRCIIAQFIVAPNLCLVQGWRNVLVALPERSWHIQVQSVDQQKTFRCPRVL